MKKTSFKRNLFSTKYDGPFEPLVNEISFQRIPAPRQNSSIRKRAILSVRCAVFLLASNPVLQPSHGRSWRVCECYSRLASRSFRLSIFRHSILTNRPLLMSRACPASRSRSSQRYPSVLYVKLGLTNNNSWAPNWPPCVLRFCGDREVDWWPTAVRVCCRRSLPSCKRLFTQ